MRITHRNENEDDVNPRDDRGKRFVGKGIPLIFHPLDELEQMGGKPTLLTDYQIDELLAALSALPECDPDLFDKLVDLRQAPLRR